MPTTVEQLIRDATSRRDHAAATIKTLKARAGALLDAAKAQGHDRLTLDEDRRVEELAAGWTEAAAEKASAERALADARKIQTEERQNDARARERHPVPGAPTGFGSTRTHTLGGPHGPGHDSQGATMHDTSTGPRWTRTNDGRPAAVPRGTRLAEHDVVRGIANAASGREQAVIGQHGSFGMLVRSMSTTSGSAVVPTLWASDIIDRARNVAAVMKAGATVVPMDSKVLQIGRLTADPTAAFRAEGSTITASDPTFDNVTLTANTMSALVVGSLEWFQDASDVDQVVSEAIARAIALEWDLNALYGGVIAGSEIGATGYNRTLTAPPSPRGILAALLAVAPSSVLGGATNGTTQTAATFYGEILDTIYTPRDFNETPNALLWSSKLARRYAKAADTTNQPLRPPADVEAIEKYVTNQIPSGMTVGTSTTNMTDVFAGDFTQLLVGQRLDVTVQTLTERYAELGQVGIVVNWRGDIQPARPRAFSVYRYLQEH